MHWLSWWLVLEFIHLFLSSLSQILNFLGSVYTVKSSGDWSNICGSVDCLSAHLLWKFQAKWKEWHVLVCGMFFFFSYFNVECALESDSSFWYGEWSIFQDVETVGVIINGETRKNLMIDLFIYCPESWLLMPEAEAVPL